MSKIDELIAELCPDGVECKGLLEIANILYGYPCDASLFNEAFLLPGTPIQYGK